MSQLGELRRLLFEQERATLDDLRSRVDDREARTTDVADILPAALKRHEENGAELVESLRAPVNQCIHDSVRNDPDQFADALFPVIGPAIRKAVADSMRSLAERINKALEQSVSWRGMRWRLESARTGVPLAEIILRDTLIYRTEQLFLIQQETGLLLAHVDGDPSETVQDSDAVSAMLTAIQDFVRDSFGETQPTELDMVRIGGRTVWIVYGPQAMLAGVFFGNPPTKLRPEYYQAIEAIHRAHAGAIEQFDGDRASLAAELEPLLRPLFSSESTDSKKASGARPKFLLYASLILFTGLLIWFVLGAVERSKLNSFLASLGDIPGVVLLSSEERGDVTVVHFLRDPAATIPPGLVSDAGLEPEAIELKSELFMSSEPQLVIERVRRFLEPPESIQLAWHESGIVVSGLAEAAWLARARALPQQWLGAPTIDFSNVRTSDEQLFERLRLELNIPESVALRSSQGTVYATGSVDIRWLVAASERLSGDAADLPIDLSGLDVELNSIAEYLKESATEVDAFAYEFTDDVLGIYGVASTTTEERIMELSERFSLNARLDISRLQFVDPAEFEQLIARHDGAAIVFVGGTRLTDESAETFEQTLAGLARLVELSDLNSNPHIELLITGYADASGTQEENLNLSRQRAEYFAAAAIRAGVPADRISTTNGEPPAAQAMERRWRRAEVSVE